LATILAPTVCLGVLTACNPANVTSLTAKAIVTTSASVRVNASKQAVINLPNLERFIEDIQKRLPELDFEGKCLALDMLGITVYLDGENVEVTGVIELEDKALRCSNHLDDMCNVAPIPFSFKISTGTKE
jgi:hypothetical protein